MRQKYGLDDPIPIRYVKWLVSAAQLDFGRSYAYNLPVTDVIASRVWPTFQLEIVSYLIGLIGVPLGVYAATKRGALGDNVVAHSRRSSARRCRPGGSGSASSCCSAARSAGSRTARAAARCSTGRAHIIIPSVLLGLGGLIGFTRFVRSEVLEVLNQDYVRTARAKGLDERMVQQAHVLRTALIPVVTILGGLLPSLLSGAIIMEEIFNWPGMGRLFFEAASSRDYPLLLGMLLLGTVLTILGDAAGRHRLRLRRSTGALLVSALTQPASSAGDPAGQPPAAWSPGGSSRPSPRSGVRRAASCRARCAASPTIG